MLCRETQSDMVSQSDLASGAQQACDARQRSGKAFVLLNAHQFPPAQSSLDLQSLQLCRYRSSSDVPSSAWHVIKHQRQGIPLTVVIKWATLAASWKRPWLRLGRMSGIMAWRTSATRATATQFCRHYTSVDPLET